jgi:Tol biopolymer transport system component
MASRARASSLLVGVVVGMAAVALAVWALSPGELEPYTSGQSASGRSKARLVYAMWPTDGSDDNVEIYVVGDEAAPVRVTQYQGPDFAPSLSPDGRRIAFVSDREEPGNNDIYVMDVDGTNVSRVTTDINIDARPDWSPDASEIVFARHDGDTHFEIWVAASDGSGERRLTRNDVDDFAPDWSPDGESIVFQRYVGTNLELFTMHPDGSGVERLTNLPGEDRDPAWSPDGSAIAFIRDAEEVGEPAVFVLFPGSGAVDPLTPAMASIEAGPIWSADGSGVAAVVIGDGGYEVASGSVAGGPVTIAGLPAELIDDLKEGRDLIGLDGVVP